MTPCLARRAQVTPDALGREAVLAAEAVRNTVRFMRTVQHEAIRSSLAKADASPVTVADFVVQALVVSRLARDFPGDPIVAEEDATPLRSETADALRRHVVDLVSHMRPGSDAEQVLGWIDRGRGSCGHRFWTLDPIDGTKGLLRGGQYAIALALVIDGMVQIGILGCPRLSLRTVQDAEGGLAIAVRDKGAWWAPLSGGVLTQLAVSAEACPTRARALRSYESRHGDVAEFNRVLRGLGSAAPPILMDGQAKHVLLAAGSAEVLLRIPVDHDYREATWDQAAGSLLVREAGGRVTDLEGQPLDFTTGRRLLRNRGVLASNGLLHDAVLRVVRQRSVG